MSVPAEKIATNGAVALRAAHLYKTYGEGNTAVHALRDASMEVRRGEVVALLGPSGAGKSTLLTALGLINLPDSGKIWFEEDLVVDEGLAICDPSELRRSYVGFVFQRANLMPFLTASENLEIAMEIGGLPKSERRSHAIKLLGSLGMADRADHVPAKLSGGQQQRVAIARALANEPTLLLADEPTAALDKERGRQVMELFREVARTHHAAVIVVTHDHRALSVFDAVYEMEDGWLGERKAPADVRL